MSTDVAIPGDRNLIKKEAEMILKCKELIVEIQRMWNVKAKVTPALIRASGTISKSFRQYLSNRPGKYEIKELQKEKTHTAESADVKVQNMLLLLLLLVFSPRAGLGRDQSSVRGLV